MKILAPYISCLVKSGFQDESEPDELAQAIAAGYQQIYIQTPQGFLKHHILRPGKDGEQRFIRLPVKEVPGLKFKEIGPDMHFLPDGKIPIALLVEVKAFFRQVMKVKATAVEAMIWILWSQEKGYYLHVPNQTVSHASATYDWSGVPADSSIIVDIHSHADFAAFFSGTDNHDDSNSVRFSGVIGNNDKPTPSSKWRFNYFSQKLDLEIADIFAEPEVNLPVGWLDAVGTKTYTGGKIRADGRMHQSPSQIAGMQTQSPRSEIVRVSNQTPQEHGEYEFPSPDEVRTGKVSHVPVTYKGKKDKKKHFGGQAKTLEEVPKDEIISANGRHFRNVQGSLIEIFPRNPMLENIETVASEISYDRGMTPEMEDRIHQLALRQQQEDLLSSQAEEFLGSQPSEEDIRIGNEVNEESITLTLDKQDIPPEYDTIAINHGLDAANAFALIDHLSIDLINAPQVLSKSVEDLFQLVDEEYKLPLFRTLVGLLPKKAYENLMTNGL